MSRRARWLRLAARAREVISGRRKPLDGIARAFYREMWLRAAAAIGADVDSLGGELLRIRRGPSTTLVKRSQLMLDSRLVLELAGDKPTCLRLFVDAGLPVPRHLEYDLDHLAEADAFRQGIAGPVACKPARAGSAGRGVTLGITSKKALRRASWAAIVHGSGALVEEEVEGVSLRLLYLDGECIDAIRRDPPSLIGDGRRSIRELLQQENERRRKEPPTAFHLLTADADLHGCLHRAGRSLRDVLPDGERVEVKRICNQNAARDNVRIVDSVHSSFVEAGRKAAAALHVRFAGVDFLTPDPCAPLRAGNGVVGEVNTMPALHHHLFCADPEPGPEIVQRVLLHLLSVTS